MVEIIFYKLPDLLQKRIIDISINLDIDVDVLCKFLENNTAEDILKLKGLDLNRLRENIQS